MRHVADTIITKSGKAKDGRVSRRATALRGGELVVTLTPEGMYIREARRRRAFLLPYGVAYQTAARLQVDAERRAKKAARAAKRKGGSR